MKDKDTILLEEAYNNVIEESLLDMIVDPEARQYFLDQLRAGIDRSLVMRKIKKWLIQGRRAQSFGDWIKKQEKLEALGI